MRSRREAIDGQYRPKGARDDQFWSIRTSLLAEYDAGPVRIGGRVIDSRGYGQDENSSAGTGEINALEPVEAYLAVETDDLAGVAGKGLLTAGRFQLQLGAGRLIAIQNFRNTANGFTGANFDWQSTSGDRLVAFWMMPQTRLPGDPEGFRDNQVELDEETTDLQLFGASLTKAGTFDQGSLEGYAFRLMERDDRGRATKNRRFTTVGGRAYRGPGKGVFDFDVEAAYQFGSTRASALASDLTDLDVSAAFAHAEAGKKFGGPWSPRVSLHFDYGSGDEPGGGTFGRFDGLYGSTRSDLGPGGLYGALGRSNIVSGGLRLDAKPGKKWDGFVGYRELWLEEAGDSFASTGIRDRGGLAGRHAGRQIEGRVRYWIVKDKLRGDLGGAYLYRGSFLRNATNVRSTGDTRYTYFDLTFEF